MKLKFKINYKTKIGQILKISGSIPQLGSNELNNAIEMFPINGEKGDWDCIIEIPDDIKNTFSYKYFVEELHSKNRFFEWGQDRQIEAEKVSESITIIEDFWKSTTEPDNTFFSSAFSKVIFKRPKNNKKTSSIEKDSDSKIIFKMINFRVEKKHSLAVYGSLRELGAWDKSKILILDDTNFPEWIKSVNIKKLSYPILYRYCIVDSKTKEIITEEFGDRIIYKDSLNAETIIRSDINFIYPKGNWKAAGVAIPVFSLRSNNGHGVGEFLDIKLLVDWAVKVGLKMIQILPINDTVATHTWIDSYPYSAISVFALHPIYLNLKAIGKLSSKITQEIIDEQKNLLNQKEKIDYEAVMKIKSRFFKLIYDEQKSEFLQSPEFKKFFDANKIWLVPYATFSYLRDLFGTPDFSRWGRFGKPTDKLLKELTDSKAENYDDIAVHYFIQYHLHIQMLEASNYAREKGIILKGDIPIGIFRNSVDAWLEPHLYNMDAQAGAPPDDFSDLGQNWKFPTYNWEEMAKDNFKWWQNRMKKMSDYFDAFRIDHILGFFRIWEIPSYQTEGILGYFNPSIPIYENEFREKGIHFDFYRFCTPYIRDYMLEPIFGDLKQFIKDVFLVEYESGKYYIKEEFNTQKKVENYISISESDTQTERHRKERILLGMNKLIAEVIFVKYPFIQNTFIPRHSLYKTYSFAELNHYERQKVMELYDDYYFRRNENFWKQQALVKLPAIKEATDMLICGEDLGMIPKCVPPVMNDLSILSLEIQRMPKDTNIEFAHPNDFPYMSVATPSSHDTSTIRGWWEEDSARSQRFYNQILGIWGNSPFFCESWIVKNIITQHIYCPSMFVVFPIQDLFGMDDNIKYMNAKDERINNPANPRHYWRYRMHINLEELLKKDDFNTMIINMLQESYRFYNY